MRGNDRKHGPSKIHKTPQNPLAGFSLPRTRRSAQGKVFGSRPKNPAASGDGADTTPLDPFAPSEEGAKRMFVVGKEGFCRKHEKEVERSFLVKWLSHAGRLMQAGSSVEP